MCKISEVALVDIPFDEFDGVVKRRQTAPITEPFSKRVQPLDVIPRTSNDDQIKRIPRHRFVFPRRLNKVDSGIGKGDELQWKVDVVINRVEITCGHKRNSHAVTLAIALDATEPGAWPGSAQSDLVDRIVQLNQLFT